MVMVTRVEMHDQRLMALSRAGEGLTISRPTAPSVTTLSIYLSGWLMLAIHLQVHDHSGQHMRTFWQADQMLVICSRVCHMHDNFSPCWLNAHKSIISLANI